jgi:hypothetical protein
MSHLIAYLSGRKTIIGTVILGILGVLASAGVIHTSQMWVQIVTVIVVTFTGVSARLAITKLAAQIAAANVPQPHK